jgi:2-polyprenyl-3-methyl-5-hydroxy-6-metoxy-1,4-benzoquinol methylase
MNDSLERMYTAHHASERGEGFVLLGKERGAFLVKHVGTGKRILDIGCRDGALTASYANGNSVLGLDIDSGALARAAASLGIETRQTDLNGDWGVPAGSFDAVVAAEVVEHLYHPGIVLDKVAAVLKPDGILVGTVPNAFSLKNRLRYLLKRKRGTPLSDPTHITHFAVEELRGLLAERFAVVEIEGIGRYATLARLAPQAFAFDLCFYAARPKHPGPSAR